MPDTHAESLGEALEECDADDDALGELDRLLDCDGDSVTDAEEQLVEDAVCDTLAELLTEDDRHADADGVTLVLVE